MRMLTLDESESVDEVSEDTQTRFTDEEEAKELNANCKILFEDSDEPAYVNRDLLLVYCKKFREMFNRRNTKQIRIEARRSDFLSFLDCLYLPPAPVTKENFKNVAMTAYCYDCPYILEKCKQVAEEIAQSVETISECKNMIEVADLFGWKDVVTTIVKTTKSCEKLLDVDWFMSLKKVTRHVIFNELEKKKHPRSISFFGRIVRCHYDTEEEIEKKKMRFTNEDEAKELNANCEIQFADSDESIFANRSFLAMYSKVFRTMFEGNIKENEQVKIELDVEREDFLSFLGCLYLPPAPVTWGNFISVLSMAERYDCPYLLNKCKEYVEQEAHAVDSVEECRTFIEAAERLDWKIAFKRVITAMKSKSVGIFIDLLDDDWIEKRQKNTQKALFAGLKEVL